MNEHVFVVMMYRWGTINRYNYLLGVFEDENKAVEIGKEECQQRGGKYDPYVMKCELNGFRSCNKNYAGGKIIQESPLFGDIDRTQDGGIIDTPAVKDSYHSEDLNNGE